jgi:hypothetical protein
VSLSRRKLVSIVVVLERTWLFLENVEEEPLVFQGGRQAKLMKWVVGRRWLVLGGLEEKEESSTFSGGRQAGSLG